MLGNSEAPEISGKRRENEVGRSVTVMGEGGIEERERGRERNEEEGGRGGGGGGDRFSAANRWPQQETLDLLSIRSDMDVAFRDSGSKAPLWDEVSRRMAELGYDRSAKKCKEKFENIYKYHKRLKNCSYARANGKTYRFFDQLEALDHHQISFSTSIPKQVNTSMKDIALPTIPISSTAQNVPQNAIPISVHFDTTSPITTSTSSTTSSSGSESEGARKKRRKWEDFFDKLMKYVLEKQDDLQKKFLEAIDKCESERLAREEAWKLQEMARIKREHELLMQERLISAAKDAAVLAFLQKISEQGKCGRVSGQMEENPGQEMSIVCKNENYSGENSSSRWPKEEVEALIRIRSNLDLEYQRIGPKGPLWEDVSIAMKKVGFDRSAKRCKEKWENINKYYRRVKDNKQRSLDSKTCPYFHLLDALYSIKSTKRLENGLDNSSGCNLRPEELLMHMMNHHSGQQQEPVILQQEPIENGTNNQEEDEDEDEDVEYEGGNYQTVANDPSSMNVMA